MLEDLLKFGHEGPEVLLLLLLLVDVALLELLGPALTDLVANVGLIEDGQEGQTVLRPVQSRVQVGRKLVGLEALPVQRR